MRNLTYALTEEIGDPDLFVGREQEMAFLLDWAAGAKRRISKSMGILARRKKGKTALLQRFFNILYTRNDPQLIPFYYRIPEERITKTLFAESFYRRLLTQYIGWLGAIMLRMTGRYRERHLESLTDDDALAAVYNYAATYQVPITESTAPYIAEVCDNDPFYIAATITNRPEKKDLTTEEGVRDALAFETVMGQGEIARVWRDYLLDAFAQVNDVNARKIVLYLARHDPEQRDRDQIREDLQLDMTDIELEKRLHQLVMADILADGSSNFHYKGLGDRIFAMVFRRIYGSEIEKVGQAEIEDDFKRQLDSARRQVGRCDFPPGPPRGGPCGQLAEHRVRYRLLVASLAGYEMPSPVPRPG